MLKALLLDLDGVVLLPLDKYFSTRLVEDGHAVKIDKVNRFFHDEYPLCIIGRLDLETAVAPYLNDWGWTGSVEQLLHYWFTYEDKLTPGILDLAKQLRAEKVSTYLASDHSLYRYRLIWDGLKLKDSFAGAFFSCLLGVTKDKPQFFTKVIEQLKLSPEQILFVDDDQKKLDVASHLGLQTHLFKDVDTLRDLLAEEV